jgi:hypothetical protein
LLKVTFSNNDYNSEMSISRFLLSVSKLFAVGISNDSLILSIRSLKKFFWKEFIYYSKSLISTLQVKLQKVKPLTAIQLI